MIECTKINKSKIIINAEKIEFVQSTPDTIITTMTGKKIIVLESVEEVIEKVITYRRLCFPFKRYFPLDEEIIRKDMLPEENQQNNETIQ